MAGFEQFDQVSASICTEIERKLIALNVDWHDESTLREVAREALNSGYSGGIDVDDVGNPEYLAHLQLRGLIALMLRTMEESAGEGREIHGTDIWKALAKALWAEKKLLDSRAG